MTLFPQLAEIEGVVFLSEEPPSLSLTTELRKEVQDALRRAKVSI